MKKQMRAAQNFATAVWMLATVNFLVTRPNTADVLENFNKNMKLTIRVATGIRNHDSVAATGYRDLPAHVKGAIWGDLTPADRMWLEAVAAPLWDAEGLT